MGAHGDRGSRAGESRSAGPGDRGGGGAHQVRQYLKLNPNQEFKGFNFPLGWTDRDLLCREFAQSAYEGIHLLRILLSVAHSRGSEERAFFPRFLVRAKNEAGNLSGTNELIFYDGNGGSWAVSEQMLAKTEATLADFCSGGRYEFQLSNNLIDASGVPLVAFNRVKDGRYSIWLNPREWAPSNIAKAMNCSGFSNPMQCVEFTRRMVAAHEILSIATHYKLELDGNYPLSSVLMVFGHSCNEFSTQLRDLFIEGAEGLSRDPALNFTKKPNLEFLSSVLGCEFVRADRRGLFTETKGIPPKPAHSCASIPGHERDLYYWSYDNRAGWTCQRWNPNCGLCGGGS